MDEPQQNPLKRHAEDSSVPDVERSSPKDRRVLSMVEVFWGPSEDGLKVPELPNDVIEVIIGHWFTLSHKSPGFLTVFVRAFRIARVFREVLDREMFWSRLVAHVASGWYCVALNTAVNTMAINYNRDAAIQALSDSLQSYDIIPADLHAGNPIFRDTLLDPKDPSATFLGEIDFKIVHRSNPFGPEDKFLVKIGDVGVSKRKMCTILLAYKKPVTVYRVVQFLLAMQCIPPVPTKAFNWILGYSIMLDPTLKSFIEENLPVIIKRAEKSRLLLDPDQDFAEYIDNQYNKAFSNEYQQQIKTLQSLRVLVRIFSHEYQPWSELSAPQPAPQEHHSPGPDQEPVSPYPASQEEIDSIDRAYDAMEIGKLITSPGEYPSYSHGTRGLLTFQAFSRFPRLITLPRYKLRASYLNEAIRNKSDPAISSLLLSKRSRGESVMDFINQNLGSNSLGAADTRMVMTKTALEKSFTWIKAGEKPKATWGKMCTLLEWFGRDRIQAGIYVFFERYLLLNDPFVLWTMSNLSRVSKQFYKVFSMNGSAWLTMKRYICMHEEMARPCPNESHLLRQLGIDPTSYFVTKDDCDMDEDLKSKFAPMQKEIRRGVNIQLSRSLFLLRFASFYQLPRDRALSFIGEFLPYMTWIPLESRIKLAMGVLEHMMPTAVYAFNHCGSFMDYIKILQRSKAHRAYEALKIECQIRLNTSIDTLLHRLVERMKNQ